MSIAQSFLGEIDQEAATTRRVLERVPEDKFAWKPHAKSMSLGQLAGHCAGVPGFIAGISQTAVFNMPDDMSQPGPSTAAELLKAHDDSVASAKAIVGSFSDAQMMEHWSWNAGGKPLFGMPRIALLRGVMLNHWYHHRGQLSVYLRLLDVPVPAIYGPSADENPFA